MRDFRSALAPFRFWDRHTQAVFEACGEAVDDCILQNRDEVIALCEFMADNSVRSYLEIGVWTGGLVTALHSVLGFHRVAAADHGWAENCGLSISLPEGTDVFRGDSDSEAFIAWRQQLGHIDFVLIDANHSYAGVKRDYEINRQFSHRYLALHDITGHHRQTAGVARLWREIEGEKTEIVRPHTEIGLEYSTMGIGIVASDP